jgi:hypothetical protein
MPPIKIPNVPKSAYNPDRDANDLLLAHIANLEMALGRRPKNRKGRMSEAEAAAYIRHLHRHCHHRILLPTLRPVATPVGLALAAGQPGTKGNRPARRNKGAGGGTRKKR